MTSTEIHRRLEEIFRGVFDDDTLEISRETTASDIEGWDSLAQINIVVAMEKEFKVKFSLQDLAKLQNVGDMLNLVDRKASK